MLCKRLRKTKGGYDSLTNYPQSAIEKLEMIIDYNYYTNCVNKCDLSLSSYLFSIQTVNGEKKVFTRMIDLTVLNLW